MSVQIKILAGTSIEEITEAFNLAFSDYFIPFYLTPEQLSLKMKADRINPELSVGAFDGERLIAFILHGFDVIKNENRVYNGATGVIPEKRGKQITRQMYDFVLPILKSRKEAIKNLTLEVIAKNIQAIKSYQKAGYNMKRNLKCYKGQIRDTKIEEGLKIQELADYDWSLMHSFWDFNPTWQNSTSVMNDFKDSNKSIGAYIDNMLVGYLIYNPVSKRIHQLAIDKNHRRCRIASSLMASLDKSGQNIFSITNIDENSHSMNTFLAKTGLENFLDQIEMQLDLS